MGRERIKKHLGFTEQELAAAKSMNMVHFAEIEGILMKNTKEELARTLAGVLLHHESIDAAREAAYRLINLNQKARTLGLLRDDD